jgi:hypothetical protein
VLVCPALPATPCAMAHGRSARVTRLGWTLEKIVIRIHADYSIFGGGSRASTSCLARLTRKLNLPSTSLSSVNGLCSLFIHDIGYCCWRISNLRQEKEGPTSLVLSLGWRLHGVKTNFGIAPTTPWRLERFTTVRSTEDDIGGWG